jgi:hypothetical protein
MDRRRTLHRAAAVASLLAGFALPAHAQESWRDTHCYYSDPPGRTLTFVLPGGDRLDLERSTDPGDDGGAECRATVRVGGGSVLWRAEGFGAGWDEWTGHDVDGDGVPDAVITVDTGGGNACCWRSHVLRLGALPVTVDTLDTITSFREDEAGRTVLWHTVPFYDLGPDRADAPVVLLAQRYRGGRLVDATGEQCPAMLADSAGGFPALRRHWQDATPELRAAARRGDDDAEATTRTRLAVTGLVLQHLACGLQKIARDLVFETWPETQAPERWGTLLATWERSALPGGSMSIPR